MSEHVPSVPPVGTLPVVAELVERTSGRILLHIPKDSQL